MLLNHFNCSCDLVLQLLEMLMNNCGEHIHREVIEIGLLPIMVKIVKKKVIVIDR